MASKKKTTIIAIGDMHLPFLAVDVWLWVLDLIRAHKSDIQAIVQMGDLYDLFSYSRFPKRLIMTPRQETFEARAMAEECWKEIRSAAPRVKRFQLLGNHDARIMKRVVETMPELDHWLRYTEAFEFPGVETVHDYKEDLEINGWHFIHGHTKNGKHIEAVHFQNVCCAHTHRGGTWSMRLQQKRKPRILTELNCGFVGDPFHEALIYRPLKKFFTWTWGIGVIDEMGGRFIPYGGDIK